MKFKEWFNNLRRQEQLMLVAGASVLVMYVVFKLILAPMTERIDVLQRQNQAAAVTLAEVTALAEQFRRLSGSGQAQMESRGNLTRIVDSTIKHNQLVMTRFQPSSSGDAQVRLENAAFNQVVTWLDELEVKNDVQIKDLSLTPGNASGLVNVSVRLGLGS